jgi:predicted Zn finger-like uncharacterized protein
MTVPTQISAVTQCPHCSAKFRVRPEQVKLHAGLVRCGACRGIFDAVEHLIEGMLPPMPPMHEGVDGAAPRTIVQGMPEMSEAGDAQPASDAPGDPAHDVHDPHDAIGIATTRGARHSESAAATESAGKGFDAPAQGKDAVRAALDMPDRSDGAMAHDLNDYRWRAPAPVESTSVRWAYALASVVAALLLLGQAAYVFRDELVSRLPQVAPLMAAACEQIGCRVEPPKRAESLGFVGADLAADPAHKGLLIFTTILRNTGSRTVAFPHLVLSLDGLGGELVVRRIFAPAEFAPATANLTHGLDGGAEIEIKLYLDASQVNVVGFKVDHAYL